MYNYSDKTLERTENRLKTKFKPITFSKKYKFTTLKELAVDFFVKKRKTFYLTGKTQCMRGKARGYMDFYLLCLTYIPGMTYKECYMYVKDAEESKTKYKHANVFYTCPDVRRVVARGGANRLNFK